MAKRVKILPVSEAPFRSLGITSTLKDYQLAFGLGKLTSLAFRQEDDLAVHLAGQEVSLPLFAARDEKEHLYYFLIPNKIEGLVLFPSERHFDFWLLLGGDCVPPMKTLTRALQGLNKVQFCHEADLSKLREAPAFFQDLEIETDKIIRRWEGRRGAEGSMW